MNTSKVKPQIEESWQIILEDEFQSDYFASLKSFLVEEKSKYVVFPPGKDIFSAFNHTPFDNVKVVIIGQDPYHGEGQAHGLCFSVPDGIRKPPSLVNIFKEIKDDLGYEIPESGNLEKWASQGVLLINATLTVRANTAGSHQKRGWEQFTDAVIKKLSSEKSGLVFLLWGNFAIAKSELIDPIKHHILTSVHPSPFSVYRGFFGCKHFSKTNDILKSIGKNEIDWRIE
jgi:uracil-DNA glycosylase